MVSLTVGVQRVRNIEAQSWFFDMYGTSLTTASIFFLICEERSGVKELEEQKMRKSQTLRCVLQNSDVQEVKCEV